MRRTEGKIIAHLCTRKRKESIRACRLFPKTILPAREKLYSSFRSINTDGNNAFPIDGFARRYFPCSCRFIPKIVGRVNFITLFLPVVCSLDRYPWLVQKSFDFPWPELRIELFEYLTRCFPGNFPSFFYHPLFPRVV